MGDIRGEIPLYEPVSASVPMPKMQPMGYVQNSNIATVTGHSIPMFPDMVPFAPSWANPINSRLASKAIAQANPHMFEYDFINNMFLPLASNQYTFTHNRVRGT